MMGEVRRVTACSILAGVLLACAACSQHYEEGSSPPPKQRQSAGLPAGHPPVAESQAPAGGAPLQQTDDLPPGTITGTINISPDVSSHVPARAVLFLIAGERADGGPPYAVKRMQVPTFPYDFTLGQKDIIPMFGDGLVFADIPEMFISARIDQDGRVGAMEPGDLEGVLAEPIAAGRQDIEILIDTLH